MKKQLLTVPLSGKEEKKEVSDRSNDASITLGEKERLIKQLDAIKFD